MILLTYYQEPRDLLSTEEEMCAVLENVVSWDTNGGVNSQYGTDIVVTSILSFD
jgi:hypothetical protein